MGIKILGTGAYLPERVLTNEELSKMVETNDEWITQRVGIRERHISEVETASDLAIKAAKKALENSGLVGADIDLIVCATISSETLCPTVAGLVGAAIGAQCPAFDVSSACSGFLFALDTAAAFIDRGGIRNALVIGAERLSKLVDGSDRSTCVIFGDGAGAAVITRGDNYLAHLLYTCGGNEVIEIPSFSGTSPFYKNEPKHPYIFMDGQETFKFAVKKIVEDVNAVLDMVGLTIDDIAFIVPHQANTRIIDYAAKRLGISRDKIFVNIDKVGNTSAASVPIALSQLAESGKLHKGDKIILCAFGGGLSSAACIIEW